MIKKKGKYKLLFFQNYLISNTSFLSIAYFIKIFIYEQMYKRKLYQF
jgi:hypothetical protein